METVVDKETNQMNVEIPFKSFTSNQIVRKKLNIFHSNVMSLQNYFSPVDLNENLLIRGTSKLRQEIESLKINDKNIKNYVKTKVDVISDLEEIDINDYNIWFIRGWGIKVVATSHLKQSKAYLSNKTINRRTILSGRVKPSLQISIVNINLENLEISKFTPRTTAIRLKQRMFHSWFLKVKSYRIKMRFRKKSSILRKIIGIRINLIRKSRLKWIRKWSCPSFYRSGWIKLGNFQLKMTITWSILSIPGWRCINLAMSLSTTGSGRTSKFPIIRMKWGYGKLITKEYYYEGFFENNLKQPKGRIIKFNGDVYLGELKNDEFFGSGQYLYYNGDKYVG